MRNATLRPMFATLIRKLRSLELEEQILNIGALIALIGVFMPWSGGLMLGSDPVTHSGFGFYTSFIGIAVFVINAFILAVTLVPMAGGPIIIRKRHKDMVRFTASGHSIALVLAAITVLMRVSFEFSRMEIRFGIYVSLIGSIVATLYAFLRVQENRKEQVREIFHHPEIEEDPTPTSAPNLFTRPPAAPPPAENPEEHKIHSHV